MKYLLLSNSYPLHPRHIKVSKLLQPGEESYVCAWNRDAESHKSDSKFESTFDQKIGYGNKWKKLYNLLYFSGFFRTVCQKISPDFVVCRYWDMFFLACFFAPRNTKIIYDVCDMPSNKLVKLLETKLLHRASKVIISSRFFEDFYNHDNVLLFENKPDLNMISDYSNSFEKGKLTNLLKIAFIGKIRYLSVMKNLVSAISRLQGKAILTFYGSGADEKSLIEYCKNLQITNVIFTGSYNYSEVKCFYLNNDLIWGAYDSNVLNVKYAISNKFFESLAFEKPCVFSLDTELGKLVNLEKIGFVVDEQSSESIFNLFSKLANNRNEIESLESNIAKFNLKSGG